MNRDRRRDVIEALGLVVIVASLLFLAVEIKQNTNALQAQSRQSVLEAAQNELFILVEHPELSIAIGKEGPLTEDENVKLDAYLAATLRAREYAWLQFRDGAIDEVQWSAEVSVVRSILDSHRVRKWWKLIGQNISSPEFVEFMDNEILSQPVSENGWQIFSNWANQ